MDERRRQGDPTAVSPRVFQLGLASLVLASAWLRFDGLPDRDMWLDESCTFYAVHHLFDWPAEGPDPRRELAHTPYFLLLHLWTRLVGETAWGLRSFSALVGCLTVGIIGFIGTRLGDRRVGLISAALATFHPLHVYYSQEARVYALWVLEAAICLYLLYKAARTLRARWWVAYGLLAWVVVLTHYYSLLWLPGTAAVIFAACDRKRGMRQWLVTHAVVALSLVPLVWLVILPHARGGPKVWLEEVWQGYPGILAVPRSLWALLPSGGYPDYLGTLHIASEAAAAAMGSIAGYLVLWAPALLACVLLFASVVTRASHDDRIESRVGTNGSPEARVQHLRVALFLLCVSFVFLMVAWLYSWLTTPAYVVGRYDFIAWPSLTIGIALLIERVANRRAKGAWKGPAVALGAALVLCGCGFVTILSARSVPLAHDQDERAERIAAIVDEQDLIVSLGLYRWFMVYEWHRLGYDPRVISFPPAHDHQMCWDNAEAELTNPTQIAADVAQVTAAIEKALASGTRVWLLAHGELEGPRWEVDRHFYARLRDLHIDVRLADDSLGLAELLRASK